MAGKSRVAGKMSVMDINEIRRKFPILDRKVEGRNLVYLDNTATSQTPHSVVSDISSLYEHTKANVHRGVCLGGVLLR